MGKLISGVQVKTSDPTIADIPQGYAGIVENSGKFFFVINDGGTLKKFVIPTQDADISALTDSTGATADNTIENMPTLQGTPTGMVTGERDAIRNNFADLTSQINDIRTVLRNWAFMA